MMKTVPSSLVRIRPRGITLIEILVVLGVLALLASFALPSGNMAVSRAELKVAAEDVQHAIDAARLLSRSEEKPVTLNVPAVADDEAQILTLSRSSHGVATPHPDAPRYRLPDSVALVTQRHAFEFDQRGLIREPGRVLLVSRLDEDVNTTIIVH
jgi:prepilin-type N-terminal cleavage/methylation domain-containing protein